MNAEPEILVRCDECKAVRWRRIRVYVSEAAAGPFARLQLALGVYRAAGELMRWRREWLRRAEKCREDLPMEHEGDR